MATDEYFHPFFELYETRTQAPFNPSNGQCTILLWYSVVMVLSLLILIYYVYVVQVILKYILQSRLKQSVGVKFRNKFADNITD
jgi:hypothetical protein